MSERTYTYNKFNQKTKLFEKTVIKESELDNDDVNYYARTILDAYNSAPAAAKITFAESLIPKYMEARKNMHNDEVKIIQIWE